MTTSSQGATVLVVDDDPDVGAMLRCALGHFGLEAIVVRSGLEAIELFEGRPVPVVLMEVNLPGLDGPATLNCLQQIRSLACVFMTAGPEFTTEELFRCGACKVFHKPFVSLDALVAALREACAHATVQHRPHPPSPTHLAGRTSKPRIDALG